MKEIIIKLLKRAWRFLKKIFVAIVSFVKNIISFFQEKFRQLFRNKYSVKGISLKIKEKLDSGNYNTIDLRSEEFIVNTFYDENTGEIIDNQTEVINFRDLDQQTKSAFADKEMIVLEN